MRVIEEMDPRFVDEEQSCGATNDPSTNEALALALDLRAVRFGRVETLFFRDIPISMSRRDTVKCLRGCADLHPLRHQHDQLIQRCVWLLERQETELLLLVLAQKPLLARRRPRNQMPERFAT
jgi:hypothetical protein